MGDALPEPAPDPFWPWKVHCGSGADPKFWEIINQETGKTVRIGKVTAKKRNYYDECVKEAKKRNLHLALKERKI